MTDRGVGATRPLDVVYIVGPQETDELRYSLRSLSNLEHGTVWMVGVKPKWVTNVEHLAMRQNRSKYENSTANVLAACTHPDVSDDFALFNDDFYAVAPTTVPNWYWGPMRPTARHARNGASWREGQLDTYNLLKKWGCTTLSYELHVPMVLNKQKMADALRKAAQDHKIVALHKRSLYGNLYEIGGTRAKDPKVGNMRDTWKPGQTWVSTSDKTFTRGQVGKALRKLFPEPSEFEVA